jgi:hypothetical protein
MSEPSLTPNLKLSSEQKDHVKQWIYALQQPLYEGLNAIDIGMHLMSLIFRRTVIDSTELELYFGVGPRSIFTRCGRNRMLCDIARVDQGEYYNAGYEVAYCLSNLIEWSKDERWYCTVGSTPVAHPNRGNKDVKSGVSPFAREIMAA